MIKVRKYFKTEYDKIVFEKEYPHLILTGEPNSDYFEEGFYYYE